MRLCPVHYLAYFLPVIHVLKFHLLDRSSCDYKTVEVHIAYLVKGLVEVQQVLAGGVPAGVRGGLHERDLYLERGIRQAAEYLGLGDYLCRHEVKYADLQRPYILMERAVLRHDKYMLVFEYALCGKPVCYFNWHFIFLSHFIFFIVQIYLL